MIDPAYAVEMARYNAWQNNQLIRILEPMPQADLLADRGAFFGSLLATANHILWGDMLWMSRLDPRVEAPKTDGKQALEMCPTAGAWGADRFRLDGRIRLWAEGLRVIDLKGDLSWYSGSLQRDVVTPRGVAIIHMFNHQTHHRGQIHAMLTAAGSAAPVTDLAFMPEEA